MVKTTLFTNVFSHVQLFTSTKRGVSYYVDISIDKKSLCQTTVQSSRVGSSEVVWNQDFLLPLLHVRSQLLLSVFETTKNGNVGQLVLDIASLSERFGHDVAPTPAVQKRMQLSASELQGSSTPLDGYICVTASVEVRECHCLQYLVLIEILVLLFFR